MTQKNGYHGMNSMVPHGLEDTNEALINMELTAVSDKETIEIHTMMVERLTETISTLTAQLSGTNRATETGQSSKWVNRKHVLDRGSSIWSHVYCVYPAHNSDTCTKSKNRHKAEATRDNPFGECTYGKPKNM